MSATSMAPDGGQQQPIAALILKTETQCPRHLSATHWAELTDGSGIAPDVAALNFRTFGDGFADAERECQALLYEAKALLNWQPGHSFVGRMKLDWAYGHLHGGGWRFVGDALPGLAPFSCWKPDAPRTSSDGRCIKYEHPPKAPTGLLLPQATERAWELVAKRNGLAMPADRSAGFWTWVLATPEVELVIVEGAKKAAALLGIGIAAIALPGVWNGRKVPLVDGVKRRDLAALVPELKMLATVGRRFVIAFDRDTAKPDTAAKVELAAVMLGHLLVAAECNVGIARIPEIWGEPKTGPDDLVAAGMANQLLEALSAPLSLTEMAWEIRYRSERRTKPTIATDCRRLRHERRLMAPPSARTIAVSTSKGSGKTELMQRWLADAPQVLAITHRISLGTTLANRLGLVWRNDTTIAMGCTELADGEVMAGLPPRFALCVDSVLTLGDPEQWRGAVIVLDEVEQVLAHLLTSATCRQNRGLLIQRLQQLLAVAGQVIVLDADLSDASLAWVQQAQAGGSAAQVLIASDALPQQWPVSWWEQTAPDALQAATIAAVKRGEVPFVVTDSREAATALHQLLEAETGGRGALITSDTTGTPEVQALLPRLNDPAAVAELQWLVASPSISSGVSIEHGHFTQVVGMFAGGSLDDAEILQALARVRQPVARHIWVTKCSRPITPISSAWWSKQVGEDLRRRWSSQFATLRQELAPDLLAGTPQEVAEQFEATLKLWATFTARRNYSHAHLRHFVLARLRHEGHAITRMGDALADADEQALRSLKGELRDKRNEARTIAVAGAKIITKADAEQLQRRQFRTPAEQAAIQRRLLVEQLGLEPSALTPELVAWGEKWASKAKRLMLMLHPELAAKADAQQLQATTANGAGLLPWDQGYRLQRAKVADVIGLRAFVAKFCTPNWRQPWDATTPEVVKMVKLARQHSREVQQALGVIITPKRSELEVVGLLLGTIGITTIAQRSGSGARRYWAEPAQLEMVQKTAERLRRKAAGLLHLPLNCLQTQEQVEHPDTSPKEWRAAAAGASMGLDNDLDDAAHPTSHQLPIPPAGAPACRSQAPRRNRHQPGAGLDRSGSRWPSRGIRPAA